MLSAGTIEILNNLSRLFENENILVTLTKAGKATLITGLCTAAGGLVAGRMGIALGGLAGTALNSYLTSEFMPLTQVIQQKLNDKQKTSLAHLVRSLLERVPGGASISSLPGLLQNDAVKTAVISTVLGFMQNQGVCSAGNCRKF